MVATNHFNMTFCSYHNMLLATVMIAPNEYDLVMPTWRDQTVRAKMTHWHNTFGARAATRMSRQYRNIFTKLIEFDVN